MTIPRWFIFVAVILAVLAMVPPAVIARARTTTSERRRIHIFQDMDNQARYRGQFENDMFLDRRAMRPPVPGTVARGELADDEHFTAGVVNDGWATTFPEQVPVTIELVEHGRERYGIYCAPCHGQAGYGDGIVHVRATKLMNDPARSKGTSWVQPKNIHDPEVRDQPPGQIFNTITNGIRNMSGYAAQVPVDDRWAIVAYVKALQRSQSAKPSDIAGSRSSLPLIDLVPKEEGQ